MVHAPSRPRVLSRRRLIRAASSGLLLAPATLWLPRTGLARSRDPMRSLLCSETGCGYRYDPRLGDPDGGIPPGVPFEDLPEDWECPECGTPKRFW